MDNNHWLYDDGIKCLIIRYRSQWLDLETYNTRMSSSITTILCTLWNLDKSLRLLSGKIFYTQLTMNSVKLIVFQNVKV